MLSATQWAYCMEENRNHKTYEDYTWSKENILKMLDEEIAARQNDLTNSTDPENILILKRQGLNPLKEEQVKKLRLQCLINERARLAAPRTTQETQERNCYCVIS